MPRRALNRRRSGSPRPAGAAAARDPERRGDDEHGRADRQRGHADRRQREAAEQREARACQPGQQVVEAEQLPRSARRASSRRAARSRRRRRGSSRARGRRARAPSAGTLSTQSRLIAGERHQRAARRTSAGVRPIRSITSPTTSTSAYIPSTCAPMIGKTSRRAWWCWSTTTYAGQRSSRRPSRRSSPARRAAPGSRPGAAGSRRSGAAGAARRSASAACESSAIRFGSGRTKSDEREPDDHEAPARRATARRASRRRARVPAKSGLKTAGPRIAPNTAPKRTSAIPRARRSGGYMSPAAVRDEQRRPRSPSPTSDEAEDHGDGRLAVRSRAPPARSRAARRRSRRRAPALRPKRSIARPGGQRRERAGGEDDRGAEPEQPLDAGDEDERERRDRRDELQHGRVDGERRGEQERVAADDPVEVKLRHA